MKYWKTDITKPYIDKVDYKMSNTNYGDDTWIEITKAEYDKAVTIPAMAKDNVLHNYFMGTESTLRDAKFRYAISLFTLYTLEGHSLPALDDDNKVKFNNFITYLKAGEEADLARSLSLYNFMLAGEDSETAEAKASKKVIPQSNADAIAGRTNFLGWLLLEHPNIRNYMAKVAELKYATFLTEDEPE